jgi:2-oxoglutarate ferredoxin oxidoreductase subunit alpha
MNVWASEPFEYPDRPLDRGKVLTAEQIRELSGAWGRYKDVDGDGIPYRTLPGTPHPLAAYFARGTGHDEYARYSERPEHWEANLTRIARKFDTARQLVPAPVVELVEGASFGIISVGSNHPAIEEARDLLAAAGIKTSYLRLRALPINEDVHNFIRDHERIFVVENNRDGQLNLILLSEEPCCGAKLTSIARCNGWPLAAEWIADAIQKQM